MRFNLAFSFVVLGFGVFSVGAEPEAVLEGPPALANVLPPLSSAEHLSCPGGNGLTLPLPDDPFIEHVRAGAPEGDTGELAIPETVPGVPGMVTTPLVRADGRVWVGTGDGLYFSGDGGGSFVRHTVYGVDGPPSNVIAGLAADSRGTLWVATAAGLAGREAGGVWRVVRGPEGLPWEELTCVMVTAEDVVWMGSTRGLIGYSPYAEGRQWFYRLGERYLPEDWVEAVRAGGDGAVWVRTPGGWSSIEAVERTLYGKAEYFEARLNERHRRLGMPSPALYDDAYAMRSWEFGPQPSDGLWTGYHVGAMSMAYAVTGEERYRASAKESMEALYLLQTVTGIPGLVARSVISVDEPYAPTARTQDNWHATEDGRYLWRDDVSSDQIDGHYFAFYTYYEHIARHDAAEKARLEAQIRLVTDYILDHNYQIPDWDGERTMWGWFNPEMVNDDPVRHLESGLYSLMILSFLKVAHHVTGDEKYMEHYAGLIEKHHYLSNLLLEKKLFPDELNHSDDQLSALAFYPIVQLEHDPFIRDALLRALRRHARIERDERNSLFAMVYASADPEDAEIGGALQTLREMPQDRRDWGMDNSLRKDVVFASEDDRGGHPVLLKLLPADERHWERWNMNPYAAKTGGNGRNEGTGVHYLLPYWLARYHGILAGPAGR